MNEEQWRDIPGFDGAYEVSDHGRVRSHKRSAPLILKPGVDRDGYLRVNLCNAGVARTLYVHVLVAEEFLGPRTADQETRHLDGDTSNNAAVNLRYGSARENRLDSVRHGTHHEARKTHCPAGHRYAGANLIVDRKNKRNCRTCRNRRSRERRAAA